MQTTPLHHPHNPLPPHVTSSIVARHGPHELAGRHPGEHSGTQGRHLQAAHCRTHRARLPPVCDAGGDEARGCHQLTVAHYHVDPDNHAVEVFIQHHHI